MSLTKVTYQFLIALVIDLILGEPPAAIHPVVCMGKLIRWLDLHRYKGKKVLELFHGLATVVVVTTFPTGIVYFLLTYLERLSLFGEILLGGALLKTTFSIKYLTYSALEVKEALMRGDLDRARLRLRGLVSRDTLNLDKPLIVSATVESLGENITDSIVAPWFFYLLFGVPGAFAYRAINTLDAMIGYHGEYEYYGKIAARLDDLLNFLPARLVAFSLPLAVYFAGGEVWNSWRIMWRDRRRTESPNAGWTMSAMAGGLKVELKKLGCYRLGEQMNGLNLEKIDQAIKVTERAATFFSIIFITLSLWLG